MLGVHDEKGELVYAGRVGTGFDDRLLGDMHRKLSAVQQKNPPVKLPAGVRRSDVHWVKPDLVGEVRFTGWTRDGVLRHPAFIALRPTSRHPRSCAKKPSIRTWRPGARRTAASLHATPSLRPLLQPKRRRK